MRPNQVPLVCPRSQYECPRFTSWSSELDRTGAQALPPDQTEDTAYGASRRSKLDRQRVCGLIDDYIGGDTVLMYADCQHAIACRRDQVFEQLEEWLRQGQMKPADPRLQGRVLINYLGVGVGSR